MTSILKNVCIDKLADTANKYNKKIWHHQYEACWCKVKHVYWSQ